MPDALTYGLIIAGMMIVTFLPRLLPLLGVSRLRLSPRLELTLSALGPALLSALLVQELAGTGQPSARGVLAVVVALSAGVVSRNLALAVAAGLFAGALFYRLWS
ncbi:MAG: AzlD domain-containing protein [Limnochordales bacterium]|nr:AzlD domain-containing protein [Limnochordales bacterium]